MKKRVLLVAAAVAMAAVLGGCAGKSANAPAEGGTFTVGFDQDFPPPMGFVGDDGEYTGFDLELAAEVAKRLGKEFVPQAILTVSGMVLP